MPAERRLPHRWDLFCRVVDNLGDAAICWRLARQLADEYRLAVRVWIDRPEALAALVPGAAAGVVLDGVTLERWTDPTPQRDASAAEPHPAAKTARPASPRVPHARSAPGIPPAGSAASDVADVVVGGFACTLPDAYRSAMRTRRPVWVNLDYLSAQDWVATHHGLPSPKPDGLVEHFFFPGFGRDTGGLLREADLMARRDAFDADPGAAAAFLATLGVDTRPGDRFASLFCYPGSPVAEVLDALADDPSPGRWRLLRPRGVAPDAPRHPTLVDIPFVPQRDYDRLLWCCALNFVRGEDSLIRGLWAGRPTVWQAYRQEHGDHLPKLQAYLGSWLARSVLAAPACAAFRAVHDAWNAAPAPEAGPAMAAALPTLLRVLPEVRTASRRVASAYCDEADLAARLVAFVLQRL